MSYKIIITELAQSDIEEAIGYYEVKRKGLGSIFLLSIKDTFKLLSTNPLLYVRVYSELRRALTKKFPYALLYDINEPAKTVTIFAVTSTFRDSKVWKKRIP